MKPYEFKWISREDVIERQRTQNQRRAGYGHFENVYSLPDYGRLYWSHTQPTPKTGIAYAYLGNK